MNECKVIIMGFGAVGQGVANAISLKKDMIKQEHNVEVKVVAAADSSSSAICADGLDEQLLVSVKNDNGSLASYPEYGSDVCGIDVLDSVEYDCLIEATPTNIEDGEPALSLTLKAFEEGKDVVTSNKGHLALFFKDVVSAAEKNNVQFRYEATVGGAMPIINFVKDTLSSCKISSIEGILNGTTNYILSRMTSEGSSYKDILHESQELGIAETDPTQDVEGIDAACKTVILANSLLGIDATYSDVDVEGISNITSQAIELAKKDGYLIKLIAEVSPDNLKVSPRLVKQGSSYDVNGTLNMATVHTDLAGDVTVVGLGAGSLETASAMLTDLISILKNKY
ncbi:homoserine dehydrogenase [Methanobrevibacter woesei]|uniref:Homoserine dehydrogenase n=1 Tax=Methanobrevibacter woesei TaxID=190976 RepID=A0A2U1S7X2_9EURY|nr:homoserine dehydrogenase [Methanobrevibacter woesei]MCC9262169.1 homoserine dehydrogenase [Methanobrevibacter woesei]MCI7291252.1 homoserine dehydrogenase [Methanobrevibacter woesei]PWB86217.1 homoserine dehydrogenase [Methanobrevibacter woesei]